MPTPTKKYAYHAILVTRIEKGVVTKSPLPSVIDDLNDWGEKGYHLVGTYTLPGDSTRLEGDYLLMELEKDA
jgi:hypothetical protein